MIGVAK